LLNEVGHGGQTITLEVDGGQIIGVSSFAVGSVELRNNEEMGENNKEEIDADCLKVRISVEMGIHREAGAKEHAQRSEVAQILIGMVGNSPTVPKKMVTDDLLKRERHGDFAGIQSANAVGITHKAFLMDELRNGNVLVDSEMLKGMTAYNNTIERVGIKKNFQLPVQVSFMLIENRPGKESAELFDERHVVLFVLHVIFIGGLTVSTVELRDTRFEVRRGKGRFGLVEGIVTIFKIVDYKPNLFVTGTHGEGDGLNDKRDFREPLGTKGGTMVGSVKVLKHSDTHEAGIGLHVTDTGRRVWAG